MSWLYVTSNLPKQIQITHINSFIIGGAWGKMAGPGRQIPVHKCKLTLLIFFERFPCFSEIDFNLLCDREAVDICAGRTLYGVGQYIAVDIENGKVIPNPTLRCKPTLARSQEISAC